MNFANFITPTDRRWTMCEQSVCDIIDRVRS